jgi:hypothetical protein
MSGPKVVRIVTRDEILEICRGQLARVDAALEEWVRVGERNECLDEPAIAAARSRREALAALIAQDRFMDLQKQAPVEEEFLREDLQQRLRQVAAEKAAARTRERRERDAGAALLRRMKTDGITVEADLERRLELGEVQAVAEGFRRLADAKQDTQASRDLAERLRERAGPASFAEWARDNAASPPDAAVERLEMRIEEMAPLMEASVVETWRQRLDEVGRADAARRGLLLDGLEVETGRALTEARRRASAAGDLKLVLAELVASGMEVAEFRHDVDVLDAQGLIERADRARAALETRRSEMAAAARREVMLRELSGLGYEVVEGMGTVLADEGRLVLRSAARPDYGVELSAAGTGSRMQMRAVAFDGTANVPDAARDRDAETIWCGDVTVLRERLAEVGAELAIDRALPVGATPLKRIAMDDAAHRSAEVPVAKQRTIG